MKNINRFIVSLASGISVLFINALPVFAGADTDQTLINASIDSGLKSAETTASIITDSLDSITIEKSESQTVYEVLPEYIPVYSYSEPYVEVQDESTTMSVDEFMALYGQIEQTVSVDTSNQEEAYSTALANYNAALAEYEAANQMIETTKEVEVEIIEEVTDEDGNDSEVVRTEIQTVTEMVPSGDIVSAQASLDQATAALDAAQLALDSVTNTIVDEDIKVEEAVTSADSGKCGNDVYWSLENDELSIYGTGNIYDYLGTELPFDGDVPDDRIVGFAPWGESIKSVTIESGITGIGNNSFYHSTELTDVTVPDGVTRIGWNAFERCTRLTTITIPDSLTHIGRSAFSGCTQLKDVYYIGTETDWNEKNLYSFDDSVTIHFIDGNLPFKDVFLDDWYYTVAKECYETGLINGTSATTFSPMQTMTRAMVVTILWRMDGQPKTEFSGKFKDVSSGQWYATSISWAANNGVVNGYGDGTFKPDQAVTREQVAVMLANYAQYKKVYVPGTKKLNTYPDGSQVSLWAQQGMKWALTNGIISGDGAGYLRPKKSATRAEGAAMLLRMNNWL